MNSTELRMKPDTFAAGLRGFHKEHVAEYLERIAVAIDVLGEDVGRKPDLPVGLSPADIRSEEFQIVWRGLDMSQVRAYLHELADDLEAVLAAPTASAETPASHTPATLHLPASFVRSTVHPGILDGSEISHQGRRHAVRFATPEALIAELTGQLDDAKACMIPRTIVVADLAATTLRDAVTSLDESGRL